jgi:hypothetical protein
MSNDVPQKSVTAEPEGSAGLAGVNDNKRAVESDRGRSSSSDVSSSVISLSPQSSQPLAGEGSAGRYAVLLPVAMGLVLLATNRWYTEVDDEIAIIDRAARPVRLIADLFLHGVGMHEHPPLYDLLLHGWLRVTDGSIHLLRLPAIVFYALGAWILSLVAKRFGGERSQMCTLAIIAASPFGFHFGRLATWYSCGFLLVSLVTLAYLRFFDAPTAVRWILLMISALALVYANYFGWAFLTLITLDYCWQKRSQMQTALKWVALSGIMLMAAYLPIFRAFVKELHSGTAHKFYPTGFLFNAAYNIYLIFVSESVAPWFWLFSVVAGAAILVTAAVLLLNDFPLKRFLIYFVACTVVLSALTSIMPKRTFFMTPWLALPIGIALGTLANRNARRMLIWSLAVCAAIGWLGIFLRTMYVSPHWLEPWEAVAQNSAETARRGGIVIANNPSMFFYLSYELPVTPVEPYAGAFMGLLPDSVRASNVYTPQQWIDAGRPTRPQMILAEGVHYGTSVDATDNAQEWLETHCAPRGVEQKVRDPGASFKQNFARLPQPLWRVQVRNYACP